MKTLTNVTAHTLQVVAHIINLERILCPLPGLLQALFILNKERIFYDVVLRFSVRHQDMYIVTLVCFLVGRGTMKLCFQGYFVLY